MTHQELTRRLRRHLTDRLPHDLRVTAKRDTLKDCGRQCVYCSTPLTKRAATLDHVHPLARGGTNDQRNLVACCHACNQDKSDRTHEEFFDRHPEAAAHFLRTAHHVFPALKASARAALRSPYADEPDHPLWMPRVHSA